MPLITLTLDPDFLVTAAKQEEEARIIRLLAKCHAEGHANLAMVALAPIDESGNIVEPFDSAMQKLGLGYIDICRPMRDDDAGVIDQCVPRSDQAIQLQYLIHQVLFPNRAFDLDEARRRHGVVEGDRKKFRQKWIESRRSVQTVWSHIDQKRDVLVSNNQNYFKWKKMPPLLKLGVNSIIRLESVFKKLSIEP